MPPLPPAPWGPHPYGADAKGRCYECGADARTAAGGRTWYVEWDSAEWYDQPPASLRTADTPYFKIRLCPSCIARETRRSVREGPEVIEVVAAQ